MKKIGVLFPFTFVFIISSIQAKSLVDGFKNDRETQRSEDANQVPLFDHSGYPIGYGAAPSYSQMGAMYQAPNYRSDVMKRSAVDHNIGRRQTGILYGDGKPIGILQPYQESFKFMPVKEERVYSLEGGRSSIDQQEPYINLMYPLARFSRSEDAIRMAELEAAKAEFLDKHYPSMLVDFKIHNKLHPTNFGSKSVPTFNVKRHDSSPSSIDKSKKKRESQMTTGESDKTQKRQTASKRENLPIRKLEKQQDSQKRESEIPQKIDSKASLAAQKRQVETQKISSSEQGKSKKKREGGLTDSQFDHLKKAITKRHSNENAQVIEEDLKGLLSDMGLIEDDLEDNAEEMEQTRSMAGEDEDLEEGDGNPTSQKDKVEAPLEQKRESKVIPDRKKRAEDSTKKRSMSHSPENRKRFIDVSLTTENPKKLLSGGNSAPGEVCPKPGVIPNKREIPKAKISIKADKLDSKRSDSAVTTTETYEEYEQRVAREIKNKIRQLKEEVKRELGALEEDKDEEDEDDSLGEPQRKKRFIVNTLLDEESNNIDPNENLDSSELEPHVRRRRTLSMDRMGSSSDENSERSENKRALSGDLMGPFGGQKSSMASYEDSNVPVMSLGTGETQDNFVKLDGRGQPYENFGGNGLTKNDMFISNIRMQNANNYKRYNFNNGLNNFRWDGQPINFKRSRDNFNPEFPKGISRKFADMNSKRNSVNDMNSEANSYNSDYENDVSNSNADEESVNAPSSVVQLNKNSEDRKTNVVREPLRVNEQHSPKKLQGYNQKYYYYYLGNNENGQRDNSATPGTNQRGYNNFQRSGVGGYPGQFYRMNNNRLYSKGWNENGQSKLSFKRLFDRPLTRRRKRHIGKNFLIPSKRGGNAIVSNLIFRNESTPYFSERVLKNRGNNNHTLNSENNVHLQQNLRTSQKRFFEVNSSKQDDLDDHAKDLKGSCIDEKGKEVLKNDVEISAGLTSKKSELPSKTGETNTEKNQLKYNPERVGTEQKKNENSDFMKRKSNYKRSKSRMKRYRMKNHRDGRFRENFPKSMYQDDFDIIKSLRRRYRNENMKKEMSREAQRVLISDRTHKENNDRIGNRKILSWSEEQIYDDDTEDLSKSDEISNADQVKLEEDNFENGESKPKEDLKIGDRKFVLWPTEKNNMKIYASEKNISQPSEITNCSTTETEQTGENLLTSPKSAELNEYMKEYHNDNGTEYYEDEECVQEPETAPVKDDETRTNKTIEETFNDENKTSTSSKVVTEETINGNNSTDTKIVTKRDVAYKSDILKCRSGLKDERIQLAVENIKEKNLFVPNASLSKWKRRKRDTPLGNEQQHQNLARDKRSNWFWPTMSFFRENGDPQLEEEEENEPSDVEKRDKTPHSVSEEAGSDGDSEDFGLEPGLFDRDKRQANFRSYFSGGTKVPYAYRSEVSGPVYSPSVSRNRRYARQGFREPQQRLLTEMSDAELFGALPQSYAGELARYKRVKREKKDGQ